MLVLDNLVFHIHIYFVDITNDIYNPILIYYLKILYYYLVYYIILYYYTILYYYL